MGELFFRSKLFPFTFHQALTIALCLLCFKGQPQEIKTWTNPAFCFLHLLSFSFFPFCWKSFKVNTWLPSLAPVHSSFLLCLALHRSQMQGWMWLVLTVREALPWKKVQFHVACPKRDTLLSTCVAQYSFHQRAWKIFVDSLNDKKTGWIIIIFFFFTFKS